jgi:hypothetical protein
MASFTGRFRYLDAGGATIREGSCQLGIEGANLHLIPSSGAPLACDLGDIDAYMPGEYEITLKLYTGNSILLTHFAKAFQNLHQSLLEAYRARLVQCLLLEDLEEVERFDGWVQLESTETGLASRAEILLYRSNLAVLPETATGFSWRYADIDSIDFDESSYALRIRSDSSLLRVTRVAKRTRELIQRIQDGMTAVSETSARVFGSIFPFLNPDQFMRVASIFKEGRAVSVRDLNVIHPQMEKALFAASVDARLKEYLDFLKSLSIDGGCFAGFKEIREESDEAERGHPAESEEPAEPATVQTEAAASETDAQEEDAGKILHWFFFPLKSAANSSIAGNVVAWEAASAKGRATYFFRSKSGNSIAAAVSQLNRAIVMLNFRREPIYLPDDSLQMKEDYRRYAIACRKIPALRDLRASFLGRALHASCEAWQKQVLSIIAKT